MLAGASVAALAWSCSSSSSDGGGAAGSSGALGASGHSGTSAGATSHAGTSAGGAHGGATQGGQGNSSPTGGASTGESGSAGANAQGGASGANPGTGNTNGGAETGDAGNLGAGGGRQDGGAAGVSEPAPVFNPWANWRMPNPASTGLPNPSSYDTSTPRIVRDNVTGLIWQLDVSKTAYAWADAKAYCQSLELAGFRDWRLPSRIELVSLIDYTIAAPGPVIDKTAFPGAPSDTFWTASPEPGYGGSRAWYVQFSNGFAFTDSSTVTYSARCVRGPASVQP